MLISWRDDKRYAAPQAELMNQHAPAISLQ
jgi:hypothetical protein